jgi:hypothetical protein
LIQSNRLEPPILNQFFRGEGLTLVIASKAKRATGIIVLMLAGLIVIFVGCFVDGSESALHTFSSGIIATVTIAWLLFCAAWIGRVVRR